MRRRPCRYGRAGGPVAALLLLAVAGVAPSRGWDELPQTTSGSLRGEAVATPSGRRVLRFLGVRYASAPRRFAAPQAFSLDDTARVVDAVEWPPACPQPHNLTEVAYPQFSPRRSPDWESEDCLFLNVFAPAPAAEDEGAVQKPLAVLVWLPGEGLGMADASRYDATLLADRAGLVVVTVNYRVGVLGFLSTGSAAAAGNWGALDVLEALRWVRRNAAVVGGDPARVTLAGRAEGAALASLLFTAPDMAPAGEPPLARRFIFQSGVASAWYSIDSDPANATAALAARLGCSGPASEAVSCLRLAPLGALTAAARASARRWRPVLDGALFSAEPLRAVRRWDGGDTWGAALLVGEAAGEGALCLLRHFLLERRLWPRVAADNLTRRDFADLVAEHLLDFANIRDQSVLDAAVHEYRPWGQPPGGGGFREAALRFCGLLYGRGRAEQLSRALAKRGATVWRFEMAARPARSPHPAFLGAAPGDELPALFPTADGYQDETDEERRLADEMLRMWANFVKTGNPNQDEEENSTNTQVWPPFVDSSRQMYVFTLNGSRTKSTEFLSRDADFWGTVIPSLLRTSLKKGCNCGRKKNQSRINICTTARCPALSVLIAFTVILGLALVIISYFFLQYIRKSKGLLANEHMPQ